MGCGGRGLTSRQELHYEVEIEDVLEGVVHLDDPHVVGLHKHVSLRTHVRHLVAGRGTESTAAANITPSSCTNFNHKTQSLTVKSSDRFINIFIFENV